jgi:hypothetical protein
VFGCRKDEHCGGQSACVGASASQPGTCIRGACRSSAECEDGGTCVKQSADDEAGVCQAANS